jgi:hypothetical protein
MSIKKLQNKHHFITLACATLLVGVVVAYMYFLSLSVVHVVMRKETSGEIERLRSEIAFLESSYIEASHHINQRVAHMPGFSSIEDKVFITKDTSASLVLNTSNE